MAKRHPHPRCIVIAGPNGAGKTTFARRYLPEDAGVIRFVNADLIATGLSPLKPEVASIAAGRLVLQEIDRLAAERTDFSFETTFSGLTYLRRLQTWKRDGYRIGFSRGWENFEQIYRPLADFWAVYDSSGRVPTLLETGP
jgi:predicted ABC-type ATPase